MIFKASPPSSWEKRFGIDMMTAASQFNSSITTGSYSRIKSVHDVPARAMEISESEFNVPDLINNYH